MSNAFTSLDEMFPDTPPKETTGPDAGNGRPLSWDDTIGRERVSAASDEVPTIDEVASALDALDAGSLEDDGRFHVAAALKSWDEQDGRTLFFDWLARAGFDENDEGRKRWDSIDPQGDVNIKWLFKAANETGWRWKQDAASSEIPPAGEGLRLPPWEPLRTTDRPQRAPVLINGLLRRGHVAVMAGKGKSCKSWLAINLSISVTVGKAWLLFGCTRGRVLYIDPELDPPSLNDRFYDVATTMGVGGEVIRGITKWSTRGVMVKDGKDGDRPPTIDDLIHDLRVRGERFDLIIIDSASCYLEGDENAAGDVRGFFNRVLTVATVTGAAVLVIHHFGKGDAGDRATADRARGSSVWLDAPELAMFLTEVVPSDDDTAGYLEEGETPFVLECGGQREFPKFEPIHLIFKYPLHRVDDKGITADWKPNSKSHRGGAKTGNAKALQAREKARGIDKVLAQCIKDGAFNIDGMRLSKARELYNGRTGENVSYQTFQNRLMKSTTFDVVPDSKSGKGALKVVLKPQILSDGA